MIKKYLLGFTTFFAFPAITFAHEGHGSHDGVLGGTVHHVIGQPALLIALGISLAVGIFLIARSEDDQ